MTYDNDNPATPKPAHAMRLSSQDFALWGAEHMAYVKSVELRDGQGQLTGHTAYGIHAADGRPVGMAETRELAMAAVIREGLEPASVH